MLQLKYQRSGSKTVCSYSIVLILKGVVTFWSQRAHAFCWTKIQTLIKTKQNRKWKNPTHSFRETNLVFSSHMNCNWKVKLWWVGARKGKKRVIFVPFVLSEGNLFNIYILSQCMVYWIHFQNIHTFAYQNTLLYTLLLMFLKSSKAFSVYLRLKAVNLFSRNVQSKCLARSSVCFWVVLGITHSVKSVRIRCYSGPHFSCILPHSHWIRSLSVFSPNVTKCEKNADENNIEYEHFLRSNCSENVEHYGKPGWRSRIS